MGRRGGVGGGGVGGGLTPGAGRHGDGWRRGVRAFPCGRSDGRREGSAERANYVGRERERNVCLG
jgi:hypothetical protein